MSNPRHLFLKSSSLFDIPFDKIEKERANFEKYMDDFRKAEIGIFVKVIDAVLGRQHDPADLLDFRVDTFQGADHLKTVFRLYYKELYVGELTKHYSFPALDYMDSSAQSYSVVVNFEGSDEFVSLLAGKI